MDESVNENYEDVRCRFCGAKMFEIHRFCKGVYIKISCRRCHKINLYVKG